jgi:hypothetical protein
VLLRNSGQVGIERYLQGDYFQPQCHDPLRLNLQSYLHEKARFARQLLLDRNDLPPAQTQNASTWRAATLLPVRSLSVSGGRLSRHIRRGITEDSDKLLALSSLAKRFQHAMLNDKYFASLWASGLLVGLTWVANG